MTIEIIKLHELVDENTSNLNVPCIYISKGTLKSDIINSILHTTHIFKEWDVTKISSIKNSMSINIFEEKYEKFLNELQQRFCNLTINCDTGKFVDKNYKIVLETYVNARLDYKDSGIRPLEEAFKVLRWILEIQMHKHSIKEMDELIAKYEAMKLLEG